MPELADAISETYVLPEDMRIVVSECGEPRSYYEPNDRELVYCHEFGAQLWATIQRANLGASGSELDQIFTDTWTWVLAHELGHAFIYIFPLSVGEDIEAASTKYATVFAADLGAGRSVIAFARHWYAVDSWVSERTYIDEHAINARRVNDALCLLYGSNPDEFAELPSEFPGFRTAFRDCEAEWRAEKQRWDDLFGPHIR
ncbi:MAG: hypothetical protein ACJAYU_003318 [Bradymonadia bacterium]|jgi:hypothetical protein